MSDVDPGVYQQPGGAADREKREQEYRDRPAQTVMNIGQGFEGAPCSSGYSPLRPRSLLLCGTLDTLLLFARLEARYTWPVCAVSWGGIAYGLPPAYLIDFD